MPEYPAKRPSSRCRETTPSPASSSYPGLGERLAVSLLLFALCFCAGRLQLFQQQTDRFRTVLSTGTNPEDVRDNAQRAVTYCEQWVKDASLEVGAQSPEDSTRHYDCQEEAAQLASTPLSFAVPVSGVVTSRFGERTDPFNEDSAYHTGLDIGADSGTPIAAAADGEVIFAGELGGYGNAVKIRHSNGYVTLYGHCSELYVTAGDQVAAGDRIAAVGSTGRSTGPHVHFEIIDGEEYLNPSDFLNLV